jgi:hypothetical protein
VTVVPAVRLFGLGRGLRWFGQADS